MVANIDAIKIVYKDQDVGALSFDINNGVGTFMYASDFVDTGIGWCIKKYAKKKQVEF